MLPDTRIAEIERLLAAPEAGGWGALAAWDAFFQQAPTIVDDLLAERRELLAVREALEELLTVADLRGDSSLPKPDEDPVLWTARMQTAWDEARKALAGKGEADAN